MAFRKSYVKIEEEDMEKEEDIIEYPLVTNEFNEDMNFKDKRFGNTIVKREAVEVKPNENPKINENLLKLIEDIVIETLKRIEERNNTKVCEKSGKSFRYMF